MSCVHAQVASCMTSFLHVLPSLHTKAHSASVICHKKQATVHVTMARTRRSKNDEDKADEAPTEEVLAGEEESAAPPAADAPEAEAKTEETAAEADEAAEKPEDEEAQTMETAGSKRQREEPEDTAVAEDGDGEISGESSYVL